MGSLYAEFIDEKKSMTLKVGYCKECIDMLFNFRVNGHVDIPKYAHNRNIVSLLHIHEGPSRVNQESYWFCDCRKECSLTTSKSDPFKLVQCQERTKRLLVLTSDEKKQGLAQMYAQAARLDVEEKQRRLEYEQIARQHRLLEEERDKKEKIERDTCSICRRYFPESKWGTYRNYGRYRNLIHYGHYDRFGLCCDNCRISLYEQYETIANMMKWSSVKMIRHEHRARRKLALYDRKQFLIVILTKKGVCKDIALLIIQFCMSSYNEYAKLRASRKSIAVVQ